MKIGARNQLVGEITEIKRGAVMGEVKLTIPAGSSVGMEGPRSTLKVRLPSKAVWQFGGTVTVTTPVPWRVSLSHVTSRSSRNSTGWRATSKRHLQTEKSVLMVQ